MAQYFGNANQGLGFLHVDVSPDEDRFKHWSGFDNCAVLTIEEGYLDKEGTLDYLKKTFDKDWPWKLKELDEYRYVIKFPPANKVESITMGKMIYILINNEGVMISLKVWDGEIEPIGKLKEVWVQVRGIPPSGVIGKFSNKLGPV
ncbi:hypothetical protein C2845_PM05G21450 [Panicum miliaceum]|uniref:DUF4283 domain-containing protein n=1 Tax=Panicum miliaceum TaxID=4540 RepID=A0A3L6STK8_PANMI|nr:hypothetical protein C2845_PM05G21450 [Panicum miliaceum]